MTASLRSFISSHGIRSTAIWADDNPNMDDMPAGTSHWRVTLRGRGRQMTVPFSMGPALTGEPSTEDVLDCLASDAAGFENARSFEEWANEYGYDTDSRRAERVYRSIERQTEKLRQFIGDDFRTLLFDTERL